MKKTNITIKHDSNVQINKELATLKEIMKPTDFREYVRKFTSRTMENLKMAIESRFNEYISMYYERLEILEIYK